VTETRTLAAALEREHRDIDGGIEEYTAALEAERDDPAPLLRSMSGLRRHIYLEETFLFPPLKEAGTLTMPLMVMVREHGGLWDAMDAIEKQLADAVDAETRLAACRDLLALLDRHNSKEEPIIYAKADDILSAEATGELATFLADGVMPEGWVCEKAGGAGGPAAGGAPGGRVAPPWASPRG